MLKKKIATKNTLFPTLTHVAAFAGFIFPFGNILGPLAIWFIKRDEDKRVDVNGIESLNFQISMSIYLFISIILMVVIVGVLLFFALIIFNIIQVIRAIMATSEGRAFRYPLSIRFIQ